MKTKYIAPLLMALLSCSTGLAQAQQAKLDARLSDLVASLKSRGVTRLAVTGPQVTDSSMRDSAGRILVDIYLDGTTSIDAVVTNLKAAGANVTGVNPYFRNGAVSAFIPLVQIESFAATSGLRLMKMSLKPQRNVGAVTSQGTKVIRSDLANASGFTGIGITVGVLSDSYDASSTNFTTTRAANDIVSGDLKTPKLVIDIDASPDNTDEGRAMMQIVQDVAPSADQCFATAFAGEAAFAANIRALRTNPACNADVIVDDVFYYDEPFFSDGQVAQAVNDVTTSSTLPGKKVSYFSSAGNQGAAGGGGSIDVSNASFSTSPTNLGNINLASAATCTSSPDSGSTKANVAGGWLDFGGGVYALPVNYTGTGSGSTLLMQWDDPFYAGAVTTDLNWYMFNSAGNCVFTFASNNLSGDDATEIIGLSGGANGTYRIMIGRTNAGTNLATRVRLLNLNGFGGTPFQNPSSPTTFGHSASANANSVAAYRYTYPAAQIPYIPIYEPFSSPGPVTIAFDAAGNRLATAELRKKPDMAAPDGGDTTFFYPGDDFEGNGRFNFFGTSAAAPHAAGVAALMLQKAGGPNSLTPKQVKSLLQTAAPARLIPYSADGATASKAWSVFDGFGLIDAVTTLNKLP
ncbi:S8 family serine peptidase [Undibacterium sp. TJN25]|uniref:S8 family serine peptidase n=1 Tax=Undibacterium sp. TJN25 TaxID=3413056 RepID=UPI003BF12943